MGLCLMEDETLREKALRLWRQAQEPQMRGDLEEAITLYKSSLDVCPTAEAHTFLGWTYSLQGRVADAIDECHKAIEVDPTFGNPYNDIGAYLIEQGDLDEAIPWLERAKEAPRYEARAFPFTNLGRVYELKGEWVKAIKEYEQALEVQPGYIAAYKMAKRLEGMLN